MTEIPRLKIQTRPGVYARGMQRYAEILEASLDILVNEGYRAVTQRRIAAACGIRPGNVSYYFPTMEALVRELLDSVVEAYVDIFDHIHNDPALSSEEKLAAVVDLVLEDIQSKKTTHLFPELWALSNHDPFVAERVDAIYIRARKVLNELIAEINPSLPDEEREVLALFVSASMEGMTMFAGHNKPWAHRMPWIRRLSANTFVALVRSASPAMMRPSGES